MPSSADKRSRLPVTATESVSSCRFGSGAGLSPERNSPRCRGALQRSTWMPSELIRMRWLTRPEMHMVTERPGQGLLDTNIMILRRWIPADELPDEMAISAVTLAELSAGPHQVRSDAEQAVYIEAAERARRLDVLQRAEHEFDPIPFDADAARAYGRVTAAVVSAGRKPRRRAMDLMIAATAVATGLPLFTTNPDDFAGLDRLVTVVPVARPEVLPER